MELFSVTCITCRATLKVRHVSAIGQILACPRCQGMVQIEPPPGWKPPAAALTPSAPSREGESSADTHQSPAHSGESTRGRAADQAEPHDDPLTGPGPIVAPHEARLRRRILFGGLLAAALIIAFGIGTSFRDGDDDAPAIDPAPTTAAPTTSPTSLSRIQQHLARTHATPSASAAASTATPSPPASSATALATASSTATTGTSGTPATVANVTTTTTGTSNPVITTTAPATTPSAAIVTSTSGPTIAPPPPQPVPTATATVATTVAATTPTSNNTPTAIQDPPQVLPPPSIDLPARLQDRLPDVAFDGVPLVSAFEILSQLSTIRIGYDWDSPAILGLKLDEPLQLRCSAETVEAAIDKLLAEKKLRRRTIGDQLLVTGPEEPTTTTVEYPLDDLATEAEQREVVLGLVVLCVSPETWQIAGGRGIVAATGGTLRVEQSPRVQRELAEFLDRLRKARGKTPRDSRTTLATRLQRAAETLQKPVTMNFRPGAPLDRVLARIAAASGGVLTIDHLTLAALGFDPREPIGCSADNHPTARVLASICDPREWAWRVVNDRTLEITGRDVLRRRIYAEFYELPKSTGEEFTGTAWATKIRSQLAEEGWRDAGGRGAVMFDELSQRLIVAQHQEAHQRIERLLAEAAGTASPVLPAKKPAAAAPSPTATTPAPTPTLPASSASPVTSKAPSPPTAPAP